MNCDSNERGVSSPFICYRLGKSSLYIFTTGYANVTAYKKRACSPPIVAKSGERFVSSFRSVPPAFICGRTKRTFRRKTDWQYTATDIHASASYRSGSYPAPGSVFATLRRDRADGGTRQRKRKAGGTPGGVNPCKKTKVKVISPYWEQSINYIWHFLQSNL